MSKTEKKTIAIIGGGASGVILAHHLLLSDRTDFRLILFEQKPKPGKGLAYSTEQPEHILNVQAARMSALETNPDGFVDWLRETGHDEPGLPARYMPRMLYGDYLTHIIETHRTDPRLTLIHSSCVTVECGETIEIGLEDGSELRADTVVLATGHDESPAPAFSHALKLGSSSDTSRPYDGDTLIIGTGLSMIDTWLELESRNQQGLIYAVSRRGLIPLAHGPAEPAYPAENDVPFGQPISSVMRWLRTRAADHVSAGGNWRDVVDGLRPFTQKLWKSLSIADRKRFLRHCKPYWDVHRHRLAPHLRERLENAVSNGRVHLIPAKVGAISDTGGKYQVHIRRRGATASDVISVGRIYDCSGIIRNLAYSTNPVIRHLIETGLATTDDVPIGLALNGNDGLIGRSGHDTPNLFAVGPLTRASYFEIDSVPDIRPQCAALAERLLN